MALPTMGVDCEEGGEKEGPWSDPAAKLARAELEAVLSGRASVNGDQKAPDRLAAALVGSALSPAAKTHGKAADLVTGGKGGDIDLAKSFDLVYAEKFPILNGAANLPAEQVEAVVLAEVANQQRATVEDVQKALLQRSLPSATRVDTPPHGWAVPGSMSEGHRPTEPAGTGSRAPEKGSTSSWIQASPWQSWQSPDGSQPKPTGATLHPPTWAAAGTTQQPTAITASTSNRPTSWGSPVQTEPPASWLSLLNASGTM